MFFFFFLRVKNEKSRVVRRKIHIFITISCCTFISIQYFEDFDGIEITTKEVKIVMRIVKSSNT